MEFGVWEDSYNELLRWMQAIQERVLGAIVQYTVSPHVVNGVQDPSTFILDRVFWSFKPCIEYFKYCKPIVQVDETFLTSKYHVTLLTAIAHDGSIKCFHSHLLLLKVR